MQQPIPPAPARWLIFAAFAAIYLIWGSRYVAIHFAVETIPPFLMMGGRLFAAGVALTLLSWRSGAPLPTRRQARNLLLIASPMFVINAGGIALAEAHLDIPSGMVAVLLATVPLWMVLVNWLLPGGKAPTPLVVIGLVVGFAGIVLLSAPENGADALNPLGVTVILLAAVAWAFGSIVLRRVDMPASAPISTGLQLMTGGAGLLLVSVFSGELAAFDPAGVTLTSLAAMAYLGFFNSFIGFSAFVWLMRVVSPAKVATYAYVNPIVAVILGALLANEALTLRSLLAGAIILLSVFLITISADRVSGWMRGVGQIGRRAVVS